MRNTYERCHCRKIRVYPKGRGSGEGSHLSLFLALADPTTLHPATKIYAEVTLRLQDQEQSKHHSGKGKIYNHSDPHSQIPTIQFYQNDEEFSCFGVGQFRIGLVRQIQKLEGLDSFS